MADYKGQIQHTGSQTVKAQNNAAPKKGKSTVKRGNDLRTKG